MTKLTTELLEKFVSDIKTDGMCDITDHQVALALRQLLAYEQAAKNPAAWVATDSEGFPEYSEHNEFSSSCGAGTPLYSAPVLPLLSIGELLHRLEEQTGEKWVEESAQPVIPEQQQPIAYIFKHPAGRLFWSLTDESNKWQADVIPVYADPHELKIPPAIEPDYEVIKGILPTANPDEYACCIAADMWNACRAEMLKAQPGSEPCKLNCWSCGNSFTYTQRLECDGYCPHCDSPIDLDEDEDEEALKAAPLEPTKEMVSMAWREAAGKCDHETIKRIYVTMLATAPAQESE